MTLPEKSVKMIEKQRNRKYPLVSQATIKWVKRIVWTVEVNYVCFPSLVDGWWIGLSSSKFREGISCDLRSCFGANSMKMLKMLCFTTLNVSWMLGDVLVYGV